MYFLVPMRYNIINNNKWFNAYLIVRRVILLILLFSIILFVKPNLIELNIASWVQIVVISLLIILLIFDYFQKPLFFELRQTETGLRIGLYFPDTRYLIKFSPTKINYFDVYTGDSILLKVKSSYFNLLKEGNIEIKKKNGEIVRFRPINLGWANQETLTSILRIIAAHHNM